MNTFVKIIRNGHMAPGKLADAELHFTGGELDGLRLIGFASGRERTALARTSRSRRASSPPMVSAAASRCCAPLTIRLHRIACGNSCCRRTARTSSRLRTQRRCSAKHAGRRPCGVRHHSQGREPWRKTIVANAGVELDDWQDRPRITAVLDSSRGACFRCRMCGERGPADAYRY